MVGRIRMNRENEKEEKKFYFFKQETAYGVLRSLVGSEMSIRDGWCGVLQSSVLQCSAVRSLIHI